MSDITELSILKGDRFEYQSKNESNLKMLDVVPEM